VRDSMKALREGIFQLGVISFLVWNVEKILSNPIQVWKEWRE